MKPGPAQKHLFYSELAKLLEAGFGIREAGEVMTASGLPAAQADLIRGLNRGLASGKSITDALAGAAGQISPLEQSIIGAGERGGRLPSGSRHLPGALAGPEPSFELAHKGHVGASEEEARRNPRARSAKLRAGIRTAAPPMPSIADEIGLSPRTGARH